MAAPAQPDPDQPPCRHTVIANLVGIYIHRKVEITNAFIADAQAILTSTLLEQRLENAVAPQAYDLEPDDSLAELLVMSAAAASLQRLPQVPLLVFYLIRYAARLLLMLLRPWRLVDGLYWFMMVAGRMWRALRESQGGMEDMKRALGERVRVELGCDAREAQQVMKKIEINGEFGYYIDLFGYFGF